MRVSVIQRFDECIQPLVQSDDRVTLTCTHVNKVGTETPKRCASLTGVPKMTCRQNRTQSQDVDPTSTSMGRPARLSAIMLLGRPNPPTSVHCFRSLSTVPSGIVSPLARATDCTSSMRVRQRGKANGEDSKNGLVRSLATEVIEFQQQFLGGQLDATGKNQRTR
jgi:hypothetical protein